jgi:HAD superfamily hydrolase (TIGR01509 family)
VFDSVEALIFDVDGTLAETEEAHRESFNAAFAEAGLAWSWSRDDYRELLRVTGGKERIAHFMTAWPTAEAAAVAPDARDAFIRRLHARKTEIYTAQVAAGAVALRPGIEALMDEALRRGLKIAIATTTSRPNVDALLEAALGAGAADRFAAIACGDMVKAKKPAPDVYDLALEGLGLPADRAVAIEDSWNGVRSARAAGLRVITVPSLYSADDDFSEATLVTRPEAIAAALGWA